MTVKWFLNLSLLLTACSGAQNWQKETVADAVKWTYINTPKFNEANFELLQVNNHLYGYLNVFNSKISDSLISLTIDNQTYQKQGLLHEGSQRISLTEETVNLILNALKDQKQVTLIFDIFETVITPENLPLI